MRPTPKAFSAHLSITSESLPPENSRAGRSKAAATSRRMKMVSSSSASRWELDSRAREIAGSAGSRWGGVRAFIGLRGGAWGGIGKGPSVRKVQAALAVVLALGGVHIVEVVGQSVDFAVLVEVF